MALARRYRLPLRLWRSRPRKTVKHSFFFINYSYNNLGYPRLATTLRRGFSSRAVVRNYWRRQLTENLKELIAQKNSLDLQLVVLPTILGKASSKIKSALEAAIKKIIVNQWNVLISICCDFTKAGFPHYYGLLIIPLRWVVVSILLVRSILNKPLNNLESGGVGT